MAQFSWLIEPLSPPYLLDRDHTSFCSCPWPSLRSQDVYSKACKRYSKDKYPRKELQITRDFIVNKAGQELITRRSEQLPCTRVTTFSPTSFIFRTILAQILNIFKVRKHHSGPLGKTDFMIPRFITITFGKHSIKYLGPYLWIFDLSMSFSQFPYTLNSLKDGRELPFKKNKT